MENIQEHKNIIIHIGLHKTGTTFIQEKLSNLNNKNYKFFGPSEKLTNFLLKYLNNPENILKEKIIKIINETLEENIIISEEGIFGHPSLGYYDVSDKFKHLESVFYKPKYVIFFRKPSMLIYSIYNQALKTEMNLEFEKYINMKIEYPKTNKNKRLCDGINYKLFDYNIIFKDYLNLKNRVLFLEFEKFFKKDENEVKKFNSYLGIK